jgi:predicted 3-demethylubiquinone-9 3-methyltransferase (glyoxalase superfamily)
MSKIYACIWSNDKAAEMAKFYKSIFKGTKIGKTAYWGSNPMGVKEGAVLTRPSCTRCGRVNQILICS